MTEWYLAESLQEISPELVMEASLPLRRKKSRNWLAFAACFTLVTICSFTLSNLGMGSASMGADSAGQEMESVEEGIMDGFKDDSGASENTGESGYDYVVCSTHSWELVNFDLAEMDAHADTIVIGRYSGTFDVQNIDGVTVHYYEFIVEHCAKGDPADTITIRLPVLHKVQGTVEGENYDITVPNTEFFDPTEDGKVMLLLKDCGNGVYRKAQEPFTFAINAKGDVTVRSNLLLPYQQRENLSTTKTLTENGKILLYTDDFLCSEEAPVKETISGMHINDILEILGSNLRILY